MNNKKINSFIQRLGNQESTNTVSNFYHKSELNYYRKRKNLRVYLHKMLELKPDLLLVGEAPGYKGCKLTGVPFSSERLLLENRAPFGEDYGYQLMNSSDKPTSESSATILWNTVWKNDLIPVCWNAFPLHPHNKGFPNSNRKPNKEELITGGYYLNRIVQLFQPKVVVAVGQSAEKALMQLAVDHKAVRHPSYGGKADFERGIREIVGSIKIK